MPLDAVIFDFGGVFTTSPLVNFARYERDHGLPANFIANVIRENHHANAWAQFERAEIGIEEFDGAFAAETKAAGHEVTGRTLVGLLELELNQAMIDALKKVKAAGYKTGCITNNLPSVDSQTMLSEQADPHAAADILALFDHVIESSKAGVRKPEPRIYEMMCEALDVQPARCMFLDDLGINLKSAKALGMETIKVPLEDVTPAIDQMFARLGLT